MATRLFNLAAAMSAVAFCLAAVVFLPHGSFDPREHCLSVPGGLHFGLAGPAEDRALVIYNHRVFGPYMGSVIGVGGASNVPVATGFGEVAGIYIRNLRWSDGTSVWTLSLSMMYVLGVTVLLPLVWVLRRRHRRQRGFAVTVQSTQARNTGG